MATEIDKLFYTIDADLSLLKAKFNEADKMGGKAASNIGNQFEQLTATFRRAGAAFGLALSIEGLARFSTAAVKSAADLSNQSKTLGISTQALQAYRLAAIQSGAGAQDGDDAIRRFTRSIGEAMETAGPARKAFYDLGVTTATLADGTEGTLPKAAAALLAIASASERARIETVLFSRSGQSTENFLKMWSDPNLIQGMSKYGMLNDEIIKKSEELDKRFSMLGVRIKNMFLEGMFAGNDFLFKVMAPLHNFLVTTNAGRAMLKDVGGNLGYRGQGDSASSLRGSFPLPGDPGFREAGAKSDSMTTPNMDKFVADQKLSVELAGLQGEKLAIATAEVAAANAIIQDMGQQDKKHIESLAQAVELIGAANVKLIEQRAILTQTNETGVRTLADAIHGGGLSPSAQKMRDEAVGGSVGGAQNRFDDARRNSAAGFDQSIGAKALQELRASSANQGEVDAAKQRDMAFIATLQDELEIAKMMPRYREAEIKMLQRKREMLPDFTEAQQTEIKNLIDLRQRAEEFTQAQQDLNYAIGNALDAGLQPGAKLSSIFQQLEMDVAHVITKLYILEPLMKSLDQSSGGGGGFMDILGKVIGSVIGGSIGGGGGAAAGGAQFEAGGYIPYAKGGAFSRGVRFAAKGDVLNGPTAFSSSSGPIIGGEAGDEALMPLARGPSGHLGVRNVGGGGKTVNLTQVISVSPDVSAISRAEIFKLLPMIGSYAVQGVRQAARRGG